MEALKASDPKNFGGWNIQGRLGEGGYSTIFLGEKSGQLAAVKMIRKELLNDSKVFDRFVTEINNLERIDHPGVAKIIEADLSTDVPYIAVEYIEGETLEKLVEERGPLKEKEWLDCLSKVAEALDFCHKLAITHKDVSPGNILLNEDGPKLIDFGISYHEGDLRVTQPDEVVGTPSYMSPEHWDSEPRPEMDIFSLGSTFIFAGSGHAAFVGNSRQEIRGAIWNESPNFHGLNELQINILTPLLYKDFKERPKLFEIAQWATQLKNDRKLPVFEEYLVGSEEKLSKVPNYSLPASDSSKIRPLYYVIALTILAFLGYAVSTASNQSAPTEQDLTVEKTTSETIGQNVTTPTVSTDIPVSAEPRFSEAAANCYKAVEGKSNDVVRLCTISASRGDIESIWYLGDELQKNNQNSEAANWFLKGAKNGDYNSMLGLVNAYDKLGNDSARLKWLEECAKGYEGINETSPRSAIGRCKTLYALELKDLGNEKQAMLYLQDAVSYGQGDASVLLGMIYKQEGKESQSIKAFQDGVKLGNREAMNQLIAILEAKGDETQIFEWLTFAANKGDMNATMRLSAQYLFRKDYANVKKWGSVCAKAGLGECNYFLGLVALFEKDKKTAKEFFTTASNQGIDDATLRLGAYYYVEEKNYDEAERVLLKLVRKDNFEATAYIVGVYISKQDIKKACIHSRIASEIAEGLIKSKKWDSKFDSLLMTNEETNNKLCNSANT